MPPRRSARASTNRLLDGSPDGGVTSPMRNAVAGRGMSPGPAKYSSAYGSPPTIMPTRQNVGRHRYSLNSALNRVIETVDIDNENDAQERAEREAEEQRRTGITPTPQPQPRPDPVVNGVNGDYDDSTDMLVVPGEDEDHLPDVSAASPDNHTSPRSTNNDYAEEDSIFRSARIFTPILPTRLSVVSKTSNALQSILNSARRLSASVREDTEVNEEAVRQAYPHINFIRPRPDNGPTDEAPAQAEDPAHTSSVEPEEHSTPTRARGAWGAQSHITPPGPTTRARRAGSNNTPETTPEELVVHGVEKQRTGFGRRWNKRGIQLDEVNGTPPEPTLAPAPELESAPGSPLIPTSEKEQLPELLAVEVGEKPGSSWVGETLAAMWNFTCHISDITRLIGMLLALLVLGAVAVRVFVISTASPQLYEGYRMDNRLHWYGSDWRSNLRQLVPFALVHPLGALSDEEFARMNGLLLSHASEMAHLQHSQRLQDDALQRVGRVLPAVVHMELDRRGRPVIAQEFWHALKDTIQADRDIFTLLRKDDGSMGISDLQWSALRHQLEASGLLPDPSASKSLSVQDVESIAETTMAKSWEAWLRQNQNRVREIVADSTKGKQDVSVDHLSDEQVAKLAQRVLASETGREVVVPRQEFLKILQNSFVEHRVEIKGELAELEARVLEVAQTAAAAMSSVSSLSSSLSVGDRPSQSKGGKGGKDDKDGAAAPTGAPAVVVDGMTPKELRQLVDQLVRKGISDAQLEAMARSKIRADWNANLVNQVNFFTRSTGATFNHHFSSPPYQPRLPSSWKRLWGVAAPDGGAAGGAGSSAKGSGGSDGSSGGSMQSNPDGTEGGDAMSGRPVPGSQRGSIVFDSWEQDGDCYCAAATGGNPTGASVAVKLGLRVVPQHLVVEHISAGATLDPGATPKDLEVWAQITDYAQQRSLQDWSLSRYPDTDERSPLFGWGFVKIGEFTYERVDTGGSGGSGGTQVFRLPPELETLDAVTDHVIVRARSNYGHSDHTCFYRLRLYGQARPDVVD